MVKHEPNLKTNVNISKHRENFRLVGRENYGALWALYLQDNVGLYHKHYPSKSSIMKYFS